MENSQMEKWKEIIPKNSLENKTILALDVINL